MSTDDTVTAEGDPATVGTASGDTASGTTATGGAVADAPERIVADGRLRPDADGREWAYLPTATVQSHAANLAELPDGRLACVWFGGTQEGVSDIHVWSSTLDAGTWSEPVGLSDDPARSEQNPVLFVAPSGDVWLLYTAQRAGNQDSAEVRRRVSTDGGTTWGEPSTLFAADETGGVFVRQPPLVTRGGDLLVPVFRCVTTPGRAWVGDHDTSSVMTSRDGGDTWGEVAVPGSTGAVHMNVHELPDGSLLALFRSRRADAVHESRSTDGGRSWSPPVPTELPNNNSSVQWVPLADGRLAIVYNHRRADATTERRLGLYDEIDESGIVEQAVLPGAAVDADADGGIDADADREARVGEGRTAFWGTPRAPMSLAVSSDGGRSWPHRVDLEDGDGWCLSNNSRDGLNRELSYPSITQTSDGAVHVAYTWHRRAIRHVRLAPADLPGPDLPGPDLPGSGLAG
ncbi:exo-alpha-sialidase [Frigoribacterium sp. Leaf186]|uniref:sialidase family protein n=1 Tax=Frigoribacterium sp. Leaf186 TaxID=1736293 RepID=UPI000B091171